MRWILCGRIVDEFDTRAVWLPNERVINQVLTARPTPQHLLTDLPNPFGQGGSVAHAHVNRDRSHDE